MDVQKIIDQFNSLKKDGWTTKEIWNFIEAVIEIAVSEATNFSNLTGQEKANWVINEVESIYMILDIDIPKVPEIIEGWMETVVFKMILPWLVQQAYNRLTGKEDEGINFFKRIITK